MTQLSRAHAFHQFLCQLSTDVHEILYMTFASHLLTTVKILLKVICRIAKARPFDM